MLLTTNLWEEAGLTNVAKGKVTYIVYGPGRVLPQLPDVLVYVLQYTGPIYLPTLENTNCADHKGHMHMIQKQGPVHSERCCHWFLAIGISSIEHIYRAQGVSLDHII